MYAIRTSLFFLPVLALAAMSPLVALRATHWEEPALLLPP